ncbi:MAG TPA: hypothetical protein VGM58_04510 [Verrucomicrobiae bacterium]|jgi:hypothetical protein
MNNQMCPKIIVRFARVVFVLLAAVLLIPVLHAQPAAQNVDNRLLLVFETSAATKKSMPSVEIFLKQLFALDMSGQLQRGDTVGVWTFDRHLRAGQFPLQHWVPENAAAIASNITAFVEHQHYAKNGRFDELSQPLNQLVQDSERLTVLIFCDGRSEIHGTPYDAQINAVFQQQAKQIKAGQPFVIVLRTQLGKYIWATVGIPPAMTNFPQFPPLPQPVEATAPAAPTNLSPVVPAAPVVIAPPLIIIGTNVETNLPPPASKSEIKNLQSSIVSASPTNEVSVTQTNVIAETSKAPQSTVVAETNLVAPSPANSGIGGGWTLKIGVALLIVAIVLAIFLIRRARATGQDSLITRSMNDRK